MTPTVPDGPDTELAAAEGWFRENPKAVDALALVDNAAPYQRHAATIVRAVLARPAAGRDLTVACDFSGGPFADCTLAVPRSELPGVLVTDVGDSRSAYVCIERNGETVYRYAGEASAGEWEHCPRVPADAHVEEVARPAVARTDGQPPADEPVRAVKRAYRDALWDLAQLWRRQSFWGGKYVAGEQVADHCVTTLMETLERVGKETPAAPADDTAAPDGPTADEAVASAARIVEAWAHLRMDTPEDQATHDELVRVSRATIAAYVRTRPWSRAGQPVRDSQDGGDRG